MFATRPSHEDERAGAGSAPSGEVARQDRDHAVGDHTGQDEPERDAGVGELPVRRRTGRAAARGRTAGIARKSVSRERRPREDGRGPAGVRRSGPRRG